MIGEAQQAHDDNGNLTDDGELTYEWDAFNRLVRVMDGATTVATYVYDPQNRRVAKHVPAANDVYYSYDGWRTLGEYASATAAWPDRQFVFGVYLDEPLVMDVNSDPDSTCLGAYDDRYFYHHNWQYSVIALSDANADLVEGYSYDPYGKHLRFYNDGSPIGFDSNDTITALSASALANPFTYTGQRYDDETGLHHYKERYYSTEQGRFISRDPLQTETFLSHYMYVDDSPLTDVDPYGLMKLSNCIDTSVPVFALGVRMGIGAAIYIGWKGRICDCCEDFSNTTIERGYTEGDLGLDLTIGGGWSGDFGLFGLRGRVGLNIPEETTSLRLFSMKTKKCGEEAKRMSTTINQNFYAGATGFASLGVRRGGEFLGLSSEIRGGLSLNINGGVFYDDIGIGGTLKLMGTSNISARFKLWRFREQTVHFNPLRPGSNRPVEIFNTGPEGYWHRW